MSATRIESWTRLVLAVARLGALMFSVLVCQFSGLIALHDFAELDRPNLGYGMEAVWGEAPWRTAIEANALVVGSLSVVSFVQLLRGRTALLPMGFACVWLCVAAAYWSHLRALPQYPVMHNADKLPDGMLSVPIGFEMYGGLGMQLVVAGLLAVCALSMWILRRDRRSFGVVYGALMLRGRGRGQVGAEG